MAEDLQRKRFEFAIERIDIMMQGGESAPKAFDKLPGLPVLIRTQGLLVAVALLRAGQGREIAEAIETWLTDAAPNAVLKRGESKKDFMSICTNASRAAYLAAQWEAVELAQCLKLTREALAPSRKG